jgi:hypothetical protein
MATYTVFAAFASDGRFIRAGKYVAFSACSERAATKAFADTVRIEKVYHVASPMEATHKILELTLQYKTASILPKQVPITEKISAGTKVRRSKAVFA